MSIRNTKIKEMQNMIVEPFPDEVAKTLAMFAGEEGTEEVVADLTDALYQIKCHAENQYNSEYWRTLWDALLVFADKHPADIPFC